MTSPIEARRLVGQSDSVSPGERSSLTPRSVDNRDCSAAALLALAARCEREEPSWDLSVAIELAIDPDARRSMGDLYAILKGMRLYNPPDYAHSLDAAVTLVPEGFSRSSYAHPRIPGTEEEMRAYCDVYLLAPNCEPAPNGTLNRRTLSGPHEGEARAEASAICAAALRARAAMES